MYCVFKKPHCISKHRRLRRGRDKNSQNMAYKIKSKLIGDKYTNLFLKSTKIKINTRHIY